MTLSRYVRPSRCSGTLLNEVGQVAAMTGFPLDSTGCTEVVALERIRAIKLDRVEDKVVARFVSLQQVVRGL